ncbi:MAG TPA: FtsX-like permease family protein [bacterium]|nr:FtsX-like permease family protein [bacterium]
MNLWRLITLAWRNLWRNRRRTLITVSTVTIGFALAVFAIGLGDGGHEQMIRSAINMGEGHITIQPKGYLAAPSNSLYLAHGAALMAHLPISQADGKVAPRVFLQVLVSTAYNSLGVGLQGIQPENDPFANLLQPYLVQGEWLHPGDAYGVLLGDKMAEKLHVHVGSKLAIMAGGADGNVESRLGHVRGIFRSRLEQLDGFLMLSTLDFARPLLPGYKPGQDDQAVTRLAIFLHNPKQQAAIFARLKADHLSDGVVLDWQEMMPQVVNFVFVDDLFNYIWLGFILVMVAFGIANTIFMSALERTREFGLLRALGMKGREVLALMICETVLLALVSMALGWLVGGGAHLYFATYGLDLSGVYPGGFETAGMWMDPVIYPSLSLGRITSLTAIVFFTTLLSGLYPAFKAAGISPVAALRT